MWRRRVFGNAGESGGIRRVGGRAGVEERDIREEKGVLREGSGRGDVRGGGGKAIKCISPLPSRPLNTQFRLKGMPSENKQKSKVMSIDR
jgi:hypothetical protein